MVTLGRRDLLRLRGRGNVDNSYLCGHRSFTFALILEARLGMCIPDASSSQTERSLRDTAEKVTIMIVLNNASTPNLE